MLTLSRYTDFLVNEILPSGEVLHLQSLKARTSGKQDAEKPATSAGQQSTSSADFKNEEAVNPNLEIRTTDVSSQRSSQFEGREPVEKPNAKASMSQVSSS